MLNEKEPRKIVLLTPEMFLEKKTFQITANIKMLCLRNVTD